MYSCSTVLLRQYLRNSSAAAAKIVVLCYIQSFQTLILTLTVPVPILTLLWSDTNKMMMMMNIALCDPCLSALSVTYYQKVRYINTLTFTYLYLPNTRPTALLPLVTIINAVQHAVSQTPLL